jgi:hypothetical protein
MGDRSRWISTGLLVAGLAWLAGLGGGGCDGDELPADQLCQAGENIFCRCPGGAPGTKACLESGDAFDTCGPCEERPSSGPGQQGAGGYGLGPGSGGEGGLGGEGGGSGGGSGTGALLTPCEADDECESGMCRFHFCTQACEQVSECPYPASECVRFDADDTICMPTCSTAVDCVLYTAPPSRCGYTKAVDNWDVTVCADWGDAHALMPPGSDCLPFDHAACNLGYQHMEAVCTEQGVCAEGCYVPADCPEGSTCSTQGALGNCQ